MAEQSNNPNQQSEDKGQDAPVVGPSTPPPDELDVYVPDPEMFESVDS